MKTLLIFPPQHLPLQPHIGIPLLVSNLKEKGVEVNQTDFNILAYDYFFTKNYLTRCFNKIKSQPLKRPLTDNEREFGPLASITGDYVISHIDEAVKFFRSSISFDKKDKLIFYKKILIHACDLISDAFAPTKLQIDQFVMTFSNQNSKQVRDSLVCIDENPFYEFYNIIGIPLIDKYNPKIIGIGISVPDQIIPAFLLMKMIKEKYPDIHITLGGSTTTRIDKELVQSEYLNSYFDSLIPFEGEEKLYRLTEYINDIKYKNKLHGIYIRNNKNWEFFQDDDLKNNDYWSIPNYDDLQLDKYFTPKPILPIISSKRCYWNKCTFCDINYAYDSRHRIKSAQQIIDEIEILRQKYKTNYFKFIDEALPTNFMEEFSRIIIDQNIEIYWDAYLRIDNRFLDQSFIRLLKKSGCKALHFGIESASLKISKKMCKGIDLSIIPSVLQNVKSENIITHVWIIFGFPGEQEKDIQLTKDFILKQKDYIDSVEVNSFSLSKYSSIALNPGPFGIIKIYKNENDLATDYKYKNTYGITYEHASRLKNDFRYELIENNILNNIIMEIIDVHRLLI
jgi:radical SAM superfamily enzyme YgiQ (UPF0313 family)